METNTRSLVLSLDVRMMENVFFQVTLLEVFAPVPPSSGVQTVQCVFFFSLLFVGAASLLGTIVVLLIALVENTTSTTI